MKSKYYIAIVVLVAAIVLGILVPLGSYTTTKGCSTDPTPERRLSVINGDSLEELKSSDENYKSGPAEGCSVNTKFTLYLL